MRLPPPQKRRGQQSGRRTVNGELMDAATSALFIGDTEKGWRSKIARGLVPHRKLGRRIFCLRSELVAWMAALPGVTTDKALANVRKRAMDGEEG